MCLHEVAEEKKVSALLIPNNLTLQVRLHTNSKLFFFSLMSVWHHVHRDVLWKTITSASTDNFTDQDSTSIQHVLCVRVVETEACAAVQTAR